MKKNVDVMLPYWGSVDLLKQAVDSVLAQTSDNWHLTILDDHYESDEARQYFSTLNHPKITYIRHPKNIGITNNFNYAAKHATAPFCTIIGCDDRLLPNYVEQAMKKIGDCDFYQPSVEVIDENDEVYLPLGDRVKKILQPKRSGIYYGEKLAVSLCRGNWLYFPSIMWKSEIIKKYGFDLNYKIAEDLVLELNIIKDRGKLYFDNSASSFQYRRSKMSLSSVEKSRGGIRFREEKEVYDRFSDTFKAMGWEKAARAAKWRITSRVHQIIS
jgi:glycosyltransferase involved in cell wall biosynthesis